MKIQLLGMIVSLGLVSSLVNAADTGNNQMTVKLKTQDGKVIQCLISPEDQKVVKEMKKGATMEMMGMGMGMHKMHNMNGNQMDEE
ncbi:hypothetical protein LEAN103870_07225 [Legionella anisa]|uniref:Uncharacterized protein n=1 Tax=Legionella anisa TaxID=28082 RepID=A0AAX0X0C7_9GAMM|nr:hypothetical protein [Legionella anisa]KTC68613.1 hypothetical protein Lani_2900 [Legionella anisa]MBN5937489.1 hypothetical protein [Legionella anisa]PNL73959.1 hypothetical protein A6J39_000445 [Legionella anisa]UAK81497.1 hypothetical protein K8O89_18340 [Legionella anisa]